MRYILVMGAILLLTVQPAADDQPAAKTKLSFKVLWDKVQGWPSITSKGNYKKMGEAIRNLGGKITELKSGEYTDELLKDFDTVIICLRNPLLLESERAALVRFVRNGGSLLVMAHLNPISTINPVLTNFGIVITATETAHSKLNAFTHPATTERRPISECIVWRPHLINLKGKARAIGGRLKASQPTAISQCYIALGGNSGKGRAIAVGEMSIWMSDYYEPIPVPNNWSKADNSKLLENIVEYLAGVSDLRLKKVKSASLEAGKSCSLKASVQNLEHCFNREVELAFYLSGDKEFQADQDKFLATGEVPGIRGKKAKWVKVRSKLHSDIAEGDYYLLAVVNPDGHPLEINPENNVGAKKISVK